MTAATVDHSPQARVREPLSAARAHLVQTTDDAMELLRWLSTKDQIAIDCETTGLSHIHDHARLVQVGDAMNGWAIPVERNWMLVDDIAKRFQGFYTMHNAPFDYAMLRNGGVILPKHKIKDTRLMAHVLRSTGSLALKSLATRDVDPRASAAQQDLNDALGRKGTWTWETIPIGFQPYWVYACFDTVITDRLREVIEPQVMATAPLSYQLEMAVTWVCENMADKGVAVDHDYVSAMSNEFMSYMQAVENWCLTYYGISPGSDAQVAAALQRDGIILSKRTAKTGMLSVDKEVLGNIDHPLAQAVLGHRQAQKINSTYLTTYLHDSAYDGRVHPSINSVGGRAKNPFEPGGLSGVRTGRMSMNDPNLQNVPIHTKEAKRIRNCFTAQCFEQCGCGKPHKWIKADFDQIEMRIFAHVAEDENMINGFKAGGDYFLNATRDIFEDREIRKTDERRQYVKNGHYAKLYMAGVERFAKTAHIPNIDAAGAFLSRLDAMYPGIRRYQNNIEAMARYRMRYEGEAYIRSFLTGRKYTADRGREYALGNYSIQGAAAEILKTKLLEADQAGLGNFMVLTVHDEVDVDVPVDCVEDVKIALRDIMNDSTMLSVPITSTMSIGDRWGDVEDV